MTIVLETWMTVDVLALLAMQDMLLLLHWMENMMVVRLVKSRLRRTMPSPGGSSQKPRLEDGPHRFSETNSLQSSDTSWTPLTHLLEVSMLEMRPLSQLLRLPLLRHWML